MMMPEVLQWADKIVFAETGKHLDDLQQAILNGTLQGKGYSQIADEYDYAEGYVRDAGAELWKLFSKVMGEEIKKSNVRVTLERAGFSIVSPKFSNCQEFTHINNVNFCENNSTPSKTPKTTPNSPYIDLDDAPTLNQFYGRETELQTLETWIIQQKTRLIAISGLSGMGKTALSLKLIENIQNKFNYIIYRNLADFSNLDELLEDLISVFAKQAETEITAKTQQRNLIKYLRQYRCLIILDDGQILFEKGKITGEYQAKYQDFGLFFKQLGEINHQSCILLNSWETPREISTLAKNTPSVRLLPLKGLGDAAKDILREKGLGDEETWNELIRIYEGNPQWLKWVAIMIKELCGGKVSQCWQYQKVLLPDDLKASLYQQIQRLSPLEEQILTHLGKETNPLTLSQLLPTFNLSPSDTFNALQSLKKRFILEKSDEQEGYFSLNSVIREYLNTQ